jgi:hypothetical protein
MYPLSNDKSYFVAMYLLGEIAVPRGLLLDPIFDYFITFPVNSNDFGAARLLISGKGPSTSLLPIEESKLSFRGYVLSRVLRDLIDEIEMNSLHTCSVVI